MKIVFILPGRGGGGGSHSVVQEALALRRMGVDVAVASSKAEQAAFRATYPELEPAGVRNPAFADTGELAAVITGYHLAVATTAPSANLLAAALKKGAGSTPPRPAYYVQDYEPLFFIPGSEAWQAARASYTANPGALLIAKTDWLCQVVNANHNVAVERVKASIDHATYYPRLGERRRGVTITAMLRPKTPRRAPRRTTRILGRLAEELGGDTRIVSFGCEAAELEKDGLNLPPRTEHLGVLSRRQVASALRDSDLFLDLSDFQAFGRTGLEGMACGCVPVLPIFGGAIEYARHRENAYLVDTRSDEEILAAVHEFLGNRPAVREQMREAALETAHNYSVERAAVSEHKAMSAYLG